MVAGPDEDFANFLEFGDLQLGFNPLEGLHQDDGKAQEHGDIAMDIPLDPALDASMNLFGFDEGQVHQQQQQAQDQVTSGTADQNTNLDFYSMPHIPNVPSQPHSQHQQSYQNIRVKHREFYGRSIIPPTPKSMEMGGGHAQYYHSPSMYSEQAYEHLRQRQRNNVRRTDDSSRKPKADELADGFHSFGITCRDAFGYTVPPC